MNISQSITIESKPELVWRAWTESDRITEWFAPSAEIEPRLNGKFELYFNPANKSTMSTKGCKIVKLEPCNTLAFQWKGPDPFAAAMNHEDHLTVVEVKLQPLENGTQVSLLHTGWGDSEDWLQAREWHVQAWEQMLGSLKSSIESGEGKLCCE
ncbi:SRPBCC family protein [Paenibacillus dakarensis]|uniref:SRPBCC family protein n=1 Tax=Paenibacillus dakarensis TaxID=1527293 RepID=UPI0006D583BD|nr:SRPBCC domain-containing protein [Paenibacillus dakarensis]